MDDDPNNPQPKNIGLHVFPLFNQPAGPTGLPPARSRPPGCPDTPLAPGRPCRIVPPRHWRTPPTCDAQNSWDFIRGLAYAKHGRIWDHR